MAEMTLEQRQALALAAARRKRAEAGAPAQQPQQAPPFLARVKERLSERGENIANVASQIGAPETRFDPVQRVGLPSLALQTVGQASGGALDILGEGISSLATTAAEAFPEQAKALRGGIAALRSMDIPFQSEATRDFSKALTSGAEGISALKETFPKQSGELGAATNILTLASPKKATRAKRISKARHKSRAFTDDFVLENTTAKQRKLLAKRSTQVGKNVEVKLTPFERAMSMEVRKIKGISPKNTPLKNMNLMQTELGRTLKGLDKRLATSTVRVNREGVGNLIDVNVDKVLGGNRLLPRANKKELSDFMKITKDILGDYPNTPAGILKARRKFDELVAIEKPAVFNTPSQKPLNDLVLSTRRIMNDVIDKSAPKLKVKESLAKSHRLITAIENVVPKAEKHISAGKRGFVERTAATVANVAERHAIYQAMRKVSQ